MSMRNPTVAALEREVAELRRRVTVTRHVTEDIRMHICANADLIDRVIDDVIVHCAQSPGRPIKDVWREYADRVEWDDPHESTLRPEMCYEPPDLKDGPFDLEMYFERCWKEHYETLRLNERLQAA